MNLRLLLAGLVLALAGGGCGSREPAELVILTDPLQVTATAAADTGEEGSFLLEITQGANHWEVPTRLGPTWDARRSSPENLTARLRQLTAWKPPYLFLREENGGGNGWRADVDHVFKVVSNQVVRIGTVSARFGPPGSQWEDGHFVDLYDRLEFTLLTSHANAPGFTLVMNERDGKFVVDTRATWLRGQSRFKEARQALEKLAQAPQRPDSPAARREANSPALLCLALTTYCNRIEEYRSCLELAKSALGNLEDLINEVESIVPGELAPSADQVLRAHPALVNFFKESSASESPTPTITPQPSVTEPVPTR